MSYILDALRRADAERERDPARGIHAQPAAVIPTPARPRVPGWTWPAAALAVAVVAVVSWQRVAPPAPAPVSPVAMPARPAAVPVAAAVLPPAPIVVEKVVRVVPAAPAMTLKAPPQAAATAAPSAPAASAASSATDRVYSLAELPLDVRNALPNLAITGGVHSPVPAQRMLIVGGQVMHEGAELAPGLVLEQIRPRGAVLKFRGYRYGVTY